MQTLLRPKESTLQHCASVALTPSALNPWAHLECWTQKIQYRDALKCLLDMPQLELELGTPAVHSAACNSMLRACQANIVMLLWMACMQDSLSLMCKYRGYDSAAIACLELRHDATFSPMPAIPPPPPPRAGAACRERTSTRRARDLRVELR